MEVAVLNMENGMLTTLAIGTPPAQIAAVVLALVGGVLAATRKDYALACLCGAVALLAWPW